MQVLIFVIFLIRFKCWKGLVFFNSVNRFHEQYKEILCGVQIYYKYTNILILILFEIGGTFGKKTI